jgi:hypothetical protein
LSLIYTLLVTVLIELILNNRKILRKVREYLLKCTTMSSKYLLVSKYIVVKTQISQRKIGANLHG